MDKKISHQAAPECAINPIIIMLINMAASISGGKVCPGFFTKWLDKTGVTKSSIETYCKEQGYTTVKGEDRTSEGNLLYEEVRQAIDIYIQTDNSPIVYKYILGLLMPFIAARYLRYKDILDNDSFGRDAFFTEGYFIFDDALARHVNKLISGDSKSEETERGFTNYFNLRLRDTLTNTMKSIYGEDSYKDKIEYNLEKIAVAFEQIHGVRPTAAELAEEAGCSERKAQEYMDLANTKNFKRGDEEISDEDGGSTRFIDTIANTYTDFIPDKKLERKEAVKAFFAVLQTLSEENRKLLDLFFGITDNPINKSEIARMYNTYPKDIERRINSALELIRPAMVIYVDQHKPNEFDTTAKKQKKRSRKGNA